ncbi:MAG: hypothetical protein IJN27_06185, partial [Oscillospiraceae bacterium]|nr:hypothetical protein [Oscillospiraceae bacterium]
RVDIYLNALKVILQIISIVVFKLYIIYLLLDVAYVLAHNITISYIADKQYPFLKEKAVLTKDEKKDIFSNVSSVFLYKVSRNIVVGSDNIIMSMLVGTIYVGLYSNYHSITHTLDSLIALVFSSFTAGIGNLVATATPQKRYKTFKSLQMISFWICSFVCVCLLYLTQDFIYLWFGSDLLLDNLTLLAIVVNMYLSTCMRPVWAFREGTGMYKRIKYITSFTAIINIVLSFVLGKYLGISGILFATSIARLSTYFWYEPKILFKDIFEVNTLEYYFEYGKNILLMVVCAVLCYIPISLINTSIIGWILKLLICTLVVNIAYLLKYYKSEEFRNIREKIIYLLRHTFNKY